MLFKGNFKANERKLSCCASLKIIQLRIKLVLGIVKAKDLRKRMKYAILDWSRVVRNATFVSCRPNKLKHGIPNVQHSPLKLKAMTQRAAIRALMLTIAMFATAIQGRGATYGDRHNSAVMSIVDAARVLGTLSFEQMDSVFVDWAARQESEQLKISTRDTFAKYQGFATWQDFSRLVETNFNVPPAYMGVVNATITEAERRAVRDTNELRAAISYIKTTRDYRALSADDKTRYSYFEDVYVKSFGLWASMTDDEQRAGARVAAASCRCGLGCALKVAAIDALYFTAAAIACAIIGPGCGVYVIVSSAFISLYARCCKYSCCSWFNCG